MMISPSDQTWADACPAAPQTEQNSICLDSSSFCNASNLWTQGALCVGSVVSSVLPVGTVVISSVSPSPTEPVSSVATTGTTRLVSKSRHSSKEVSRFIFCFLPLVVIFLRLSYHRHVWLATFLQPDHNLFTISTQSVFVLFIGPS